jgi:hypothetical protein
MIPVGDLDIAIPTQGPRGRGIALPWDDIDPLLGTMPDQALARRFGAHWSTIFGRRVRLGVPTFRRPSGIDWQSIDPLLGLVTDTVLAARAGVSATTIGDRRRLRGIPAFVEPHAKATDDDAPKPTGRWLEPQRRTPWSSHVLAGVGIWDCGHRTPRAPGSDGWGSDRDG